MILAKYGENGCFVAIATWNKVLNNAILMQIATFISIGNTFIGSKTTAKKVSSAWTPKTVI